MAFSLQETACAKGAPGWTALLIVALDRLASIEGVVALIERIYRKPMMGQILEDWGWLVLMIFGLGWLWWVGRKEDAPKEKSADDGKGDRVFRDQAALRAAGLDYDTVFNDEGVKKVWIGSMVGGHLRDMNDVQLEKVEKLILAHPTSSLLPYLYDARWEEGEQAPEEQMEYGLESSREAARRAHANGAAVVYQELPVIQCLIVYRHDNRNWLRWEAVLPSAKPKDWPSTYVSQLGNSSVFTRVADAFLRHHEAGEQYVRPSGSGVDRPDAMDQMSEEERARQTERFARITAQLSYLSAEQKAFLLSLLVDGPRRIADDEDEVFRSLEAEGFLEKHIHVGDHRLDTWRVAEDIEGILRNRLIRD